MLLDILNKPGIQKHSITLEFWANFSSKFMHLVCELVDQTKDICPPNGYFNSILTSLPPMPGAEFISETTLIDKWNKLNEHLTAICCAPPSKEPFTRLEFITKNYPKWLEVGRIHFHLAESPGNATLPFMFLSTYAVRLPGKSRTQHLPIGSAIKMRSLVNDSSGLKVLLTPIATAAKKCSFLSSILNNKRIYQACELTAIQAYRFLASIEIYQESGIIVKLPKAWSQQRPPSAKISVEISQSKTKSRVGFNSLMRFSTSITIDGVKLTSEQLKVLMESDAPLISFGGRWVSIDSKKIESILAKWNKAQSLAGESLSFSDAMKLLSGSKVKGISTTPEMSTDDRPWIEFVANKNLEGVINQLVSPDLFCPNSRESIILKKDLHATLRPYQLRGVRWLYFLKELGLGACLADDMGLGKTIQVIAFFLLCKNTRLNANKNSASNLVIAPASLIANWQQEIARFAPSLSVFVAHPSEHGKNKSPSFSEDDLDSDGKTQFRTGNFNLGKYDVILTTYSMATRLKWIATQHWETIIVDEAQTIKNPRAQISISLRNLNADSKYALTGTPIENKLLDLWAIFDFCCPALLGTAKEFESYTKALASNPSKDTYRPLRTLVQPYLLRRKKTDKSIISDLPDKIEMASYCTLTAKQVNLYQKTVEDLVSSVKSMEQDDPKRRGIILGSLQKFKQICNHPSQYLNDQVYNSQDSGKFASLSDITRTIYERGEKVLIFTQFRELTDILEAHVAEIFGKTGFVLHGGTPIRKRQELVSRFNQSIGPIHFILSLKAAGTGLNLTAANHVVHFDRWWNPAVEDQATDRAFRIGQKKNVMIHKFITRGTIEEQIDKMIMDKRKTAGQTLGEKSELKITGLSNEELVNLISLDLSKI